MTFDPRFPQGRPNTAVMRLQVDYEQLKKDEKQALEDLRKIQEELERIRWNKEDIEKLLGIKRDLYDR